MEYIDCKAYAQDILDEVKAIPDKKELWILSMGDNPASESYMRGKMRDCDYCDIPCSYIKVNTPNSLIDHILRANTTPNVGGVIVQLPLPNGMNEDYYTNLISRVKDVDGFSDNSDFHPCTPEGIMYVLNKELGDLTGKRALVIGRGKLVGTPIAAMLLAANCTVTVAHSKTANLNELLATNDIIISAVGKPNTVDLRLCAQAKIVIDVGVNRDENGKLCGDCFNFDPMGIDIKVTPVPGGIGLLTRAMLMKHMSET